MEVVAEWYDASGDRARARAGVWAMYERTYAHIGLTVVRAEDLDEYDIWELALDAEHRPVAFRLGRTTAFGVKGGLVGSDDSRAGKLALRTHLRDWFQQNGHYAEVSHAVEKLAAPGASAVCATDVSGIINKAITPQADGLHYARTLAVVGPVVKVLIGKPRGVQTTRYDQPACPAVGLGRVSTPRAASDRSRAALLDHLASLAL